MDKPARRFIAFIVGLSMIFAVFPIGARAFVGLQNPGLLDAESFFSATSRLIYENWDDDFVDIIVFTVNSPNMVIDGVQTKIDPNIDTRPVIVNDVVMLPIDVMVNLAGGYIYFDATEQTITIDAEQIIELEIGSAEVIVDGIPEYIEAAPVIIDGRPMVYAYGFAEYLGFEVAWDPAAMELILTRDFQTMRLIVRTSSHMDFSGLGAAYIVRGLDNIAVIQFNSIYETQEAYKQLSANSNVVWVEPDLVLSAPIQSNFASEYYYPLSIEEMLEVSIANAHRSWGVDRIGANRYAQYLIDTGQTQRQIVVAIVDTGVFINHPFFQGRILNAGRCFITNTYNAYDAHGHGTHVAGTVVDSTPGLYNIQILPVKVIANGGRGTALALGNGIRWSASRADVLNLSLGGEGHDSWIYESTLYAINTHGVTMVAVAGNNRINAANITPANIRQVLAVSASDSANRPATFNNWGSPPIDIAAPGVYIYSTSRTGGFVFESGTSMAAPHVSAAVAMYILDNPWLSPAQIQAAFRNYVTVPAGWNLRYGTGILNMDLIFRNALSGWHHVEGGIAYYRNGVRVGLGSGQGGYFARNLLPGLDFFFNNEGINQRGLISYGNAWHYFDSIYGNRLMSGFDSWWVHPSGRFSFLHLDGTKPRNGAITINWDCPHGPGEAAYLFDADGFLITDFDFDIANGYSVHSAFGEWHIMATSFFNRVENFNVANGGAGWFQPQPGVFRYLTDDGLFKTGPAVIVNGRITIPANQLNNAWTIISGHEFLFCVDGYLQFGWVYANGNRVAYIGANGIRTFGVTEHNSIIASDMPITINIPQLSESTEVLTDNEAALQLLSS